MIAQLIISFILFFRSHFQEIQDPHMEVILIYNEDINFFLSSIIRDMLYGTCDGMECRRKYQFRQMFMVLLLRMQDRYCTLILTFRSFFCKFFKLLILNLLGHPSQFLILLTLLKVESNNCRLTWLHTLQSPSHICRGLVVLVELGFDL